MLMLLRSLWLHTLFMNMFFRELPNIHNTLLQGDAQISVANTFDHEDGISFAPKLAKIEFRIFAKNVSASAMRQKSNL